ncbi:hypothetical protein [Virgibacillus proomii]|uniref:hypothetical protein n=1 Tax=Virgibacillus proomii TaxID=84407 RepID=UPI001C110784|nr:hypothetical protein [Virgibacillus proomii]MBU5265972.1 hypothetical protein [Virgibacillus proomii]
MTLREKQHLNARFVLAQQDKESFGSNTPHTEKAFFFFKDREASKTNFTIFSRTL